MIKEPNDKPLDATELTKTISPRRTIFGSVTASMTWDFTKRRLLVPVLLSIRRWRAMTRSSSVSHLALVGLSGTMNKNKAPQATVTPPRRRQMIFQDEMLP